MFLIGMGMLLLIKNRKLLGVGIIGVMLILPLSERAQERFLEIGSSAMALITNSSEYTVEASARFRIQSWQETIAVFQDRPFFGTGYNTLLEARRAKGFEKDPTKHSASGADSSLMLILATSGIVGFSLFLWFYIQLLRFLWKVGHESKDLRSHLALGLWAATFGLFVHSFFVNSLFFPFIMIPYWVLVGILLLGKKTTPNPRN
jgi:O-antigen ligase